MKINIGKLIAILGAVIFGFMLGGCASPKDTDTVAAEDSQKYIVKRFHSSTKIVISGSCDGKKFTVDAGQVNAGEHRVTCGADEENLVVVKFESNSNIGDFQIDSDKLAESARADGVAVVPSQGVVRSQTPFSLNENKKDEFEQLRKRMESDSQERRKRNEQSQQDDEERRRQRSQHYEEDRKRSEQSQRDWQDRQRQQAQHYEQERRRNEQYQRQSQERQSQERQRQQNQQDLWRKR